MRRVQLDAVIKATKAADVYDAVFRFERYPELAPHVRSTTVRQSCPAPTGSSDWELYFRSGLLRWTEDERFDREALRMEFEQTDGDFDSFTGTWALTQDGPDTALRFEAEFDFGISSLEGILDPIAERVIKETVAWVVAGMFGDVRLSEQMDLENAPATTAGVKR